jgi:hypothetical protein
MKNAFRAAFTAVVATSLAAPAFANTVSTNAVQLTVSQAANNQTGVTQGGQFAIQGNGLTAATIPTLTAAGLLAVANTAGFTAAENTSFSYLGTARQADTVGAGGAIAANAGRHTGTFSDMTTKTSNGAALGTLSITAAGVASIAAGAGAGSTATGIVSSTNAGRYAQVENRRVVTSANTQNITNSDVQQTKFSANGNGMQAVTNGGFSDIGTALGVAIAPTVLTGAGCGGTSACAGGGAFNLTNEVTAGQNGVAMTVSSTDATTPAYGVVDFSAGGTTAGAITFTNLNTVAVLGGGAGTSSSLSKVGELTAFN